ncbi:MAG: asparagine synthase (glutamine-hydrolyzing) [Ignavibacteria bacterium]
MCGICGIINFDKKPVEEYLIKKMMWKIKHRGPDDVGFFIDGNIGLGFVRLSILDLSPLGHQPMFDETKRYIIIHNGEVYNFLEIRNELKRKGYNFKSNTDTEVILYSFIEWGEDCLHKFNGMWAFCILDTQTKDIFFSRDRYGVKPFYYYLDTNIFVFASEIPAILAVLNQKSSPNVHAIFDYLTFNRTDQTETTFFNGIKKLQHGSLIRISGNQLSIQKWYDLRANVSQNDGFQSPEEYRELFSSAVGLRLRSDVPIGVCLSGGLDSSSIVSILLKEYGKNDLNTFSAIYGEGKRGDESYFIRLYKKSVNMMHFTYPTAETLLNDLENFILVHAEPIPSTAPYAQFKVMELAQKYVVVTLDGQGADEKLAGYHYFYGYYYKDLLRRFRLLRLLSEIIHYLSLHKSVYGLKTFLYFLLPSNLRTFVRVNEKGYIKDSFVKHFSSNNTISTNLYNSDTLNKALFDHFEYKLEHLLKWEDRNSMFFSLESRVPFLDFRLVEKTLALDSDKIINKGWSKYILREAMKGILPEEIRLRKDKIGFMTPDDEWFREQKFQKFVNELLSSDSFSSRNIVDVKKAKVIYQNHLDKKIQASKEIWKWVHLELWFRKFID